MHRTVITSRIVLVVLLSVVGVTIASPANGQPISQTGGRVFGLVGGSFGDGGSAVMISGGAGLRVTRSLGVDFELLHVNDLDLSGGDFFIQRSERLSIFPPIEIRHEGNVTAFLTKMTVEFPVANDRLIPFVTGSGGVGRLSERFSFEFPDRPVLTRSAIDARLIRPFGDISRPETGLAVTVGGGLDVRLWRGLAVGADVCWLRLLASRDTLDFPHIAARVSYRF